MVNRDDRGFWASLTPQDAAKLAITAVFTPSIAYLVVIGSQTNQGGMVGLGIAMVGVLGAFWGAPKKSGGGDA